MMRNLKSLPLAILFCSTFITVFSQGVEPREWENPAVFERNQVKGHTTLMPFDSLEKALEGRRQDSSSYLSLNGAWRFHWAEVPESAPGDFYQDRYDDSGWKSIQVPGNWQMQGFGYPVFRNIAHPFKSDPPRVPSDFNPVGSYRRTFNLPANWDGRQVFLRFEGVKSASYVWVNGREVGYNQGGMEPAEYDVTQYVRPGLNTIGVRVLRFSDGTYLEDQDMWRLSGIYRDVYLWSAPRQHIRDFYLTTDLDADYRNAVLRVGAELANYSVGESSNAFVRLRLFDVQGIEVVPGGVRGRTVTIGPGGEASVELEMHVSEPRKWSAEKPALYTAVLELLNGAGQLVEILSHRIGFREVEIRGQQVLVNGVPIKFNGVNSHMHHPDFGRAVDRETMRQDLVLMKRFNVNLVRTSHYPPPVEYLELADELGIYVIDETGDEAHATIEISEDPAWREAYLDRARKMVLRDRNHPSIVIWSAGNESGSGDNICALIEEGKRLDPSRPGWMYGGNNDYTGGFARLFNPTRCEDIVGPRYPTPAVLENAVAKVPESEDPRPSFMDEYIAVTGNGLGALEEYWDLVYRYPRLTGGAIWDWISPGVRRAARLTPNLGRGQVPATIQGPAELVVGRQGNAVALSGHDAWVEAYRSRELDGARGSITVEAWVYPRRWNGHGWFVNRGSGEFGLIQSDEKTLEFFIVDGDRVSASAPVPSDWGFKWHHLAGVFDGRELSLFVDRELVASVPHQGSIELSRYPVNIGRQADLVGQEHPGQLCNAVIDSVRIFPRALEVSELGRSAPPLQAESLLWLDFESVEEAGDYFSLGIGGRSYGLIWPDRKIQPELWQLKKTPQPVKVEAVDPQHGILRVTNRFNFTDLRELDTRWELRADDEIIRSGSIDLAAAPHETVDVAIPCCQVSSSQSAGELWLTVSFFLPNATNWAPAGHEVAWEQFRIIPSLVGVMGSGSASQEGPALDIAGDLITVTGEGFEYRFNRKQGTLTSLRFEGSEVLEQGPMPSLWWAPIANDFDPSWGMPKMANEWHAVGLDRLEHQVDGVEARSEEGKAVVRIDFTSAAPGKDTRFVSRLIYRIDGAGLLEVAHEVNPEGPMPPWLPRVGLQLKVKEELQEMSWFGRGPFETYPDRKTGAKVGLYSGNVREQYVPYLIPQEFGNKTEVRWAALASEQVGLLAWGDQLLNVSAQEFDTDNLARAEYPFQLKKQGAITLNLDHALAGVGCTAIKTLEAYQVKPGQFSYKVYLKPFNTAQAPKEVYRELLAKVRP